MTVTGSANSAAVLHAPGDVRREDRGVPQPAAREASATEGVDVVLVGGHYRGDLDSCLGSDVSEQLRGMRADIAFLAPPAIAGGVLYHPISESAAVKRAMLSAAQRHILLADASKYGRSAPFAFAEAADFDVLVTEPSAPEGERGIFTEAGVRLETVHSQLRHRS